MCNNPTQSDRGCKGEAGGGDRPACVQRAAGGAQGALLRLGLGLLFRGSCTDGTFRAAAGFAGRASSSLLQLPHLFSRLPACTILLNPNPAYFATCNAFNAGCFRPLQRRLRPDRRAVPPPAQQLGRCECCLLEITAGECLLRLLKWPTTSTQMLSNGLWHSCILTRSPGSR